MLSFKNFKVLVILNLFSSLVVTIILDPTEKQRELWKTEKNREISCKKTKKKKNVLKIALEVKSRPVRRGLIERPPPLVLDLAFDPWKFAERAGFKSTVDLSRGAPV